VFRSRKENEHRLPIHPSHFSLIPEAVRSSIRFEKGYGEPFGWSDEQLNGIFGGVADRSDIMATSDVVLLPKPLPEDLNEVREGGTVWGWPHCVQQADMTQCAIDRKLTLIAWEAMFTWGKGGTRQLHIFERNNEMAGYCSVLHAMGLMGMDGSYGPQTKAIVISHGSVGRGAIYALQGRGFREINVYTQRPPWAVHDKIVGCRYGQLVRAENGHGMLVIEEDGSNRRLIDALASCDLIVNGILQNTDDPLMYIQEGEESRMRPGSLIVDVSCDLEMGFPFARPTSFVHPTFEAGPAMYYAVDHSPSYLWRSASWEISKVVVPFIEDVMRGPKAWAANETLHRAIEIYEGTVRNEDILHFQGRSAEYPHTIVE